MIKIRKYKILWIILSIISIIIFFIANFLRASSYGKIDWKVVSYACIIAALFIIFIYLGRKLRERLHLT